MGKKIAQTSGQQIDWHYSGGIAQVLYIGDRDVILKAIEKIPCPGRVLKMLGINEPGLFRNMDRF